MKEIICAGMLSTIQKIGRYTIMKKEFTKRGEMDDYSSTLWSVGSIRCFTVSQDFPHIEEDSLNPAISCVAYKVNLNCCNPFEISEEQMQNSLRGNDA